MTSHGKRQKKHNQKAKRLKKTEKKLTKTKVKLRSAGWKNQLDGWPTHQQKTGRSKMASTEKIAKSNRSSKKKTRTFSLQKSRACGHTVPCQVFFFMFKVDGRAPLQGSAMPANWQSHPLMGLPKVGSTYYTQPAHQLCRGIEPRLPLLQKFQPTTPTYNHKLTK